MKKREEQDDPKKYGRAQTTAQYLVFARLRSNCEGDRTWRSPVPFGSSQRLFAAPSSCADPARPGCCQMAQQSRAQTAASSTFPRKADSEDCEPDFAWPAQVFVSPVQTCLGVEEEGSLGSLLQGSRHSDEGNARALAHRVR